jgi:hypothetical protein
VNVDNVIVPNSLLSLFEPISETLPLINIHGGNMYLIGSTIQLKWLFTAMLITWLLPNCYEYILKGKPLITYNKLAGVTRFKINYTHSLFLAALILYNFHTMMSIINSEFLYFDF